LTEGGAQKFKESLSSPAGFSDFLVAWIRVTEVSTWPSSKAEARESEATPIRSSLPTSES